MNPLTSTPRRKPTNNGGTDDAALLSDDVIMQLYGETVAQYFHRKQLFAGDYTKENQEEESLYENAEFLKSLNFGGKSSDDRTSGCDQIGNHSSVQPADKTVYHSIDTFLKDLDSSGINVLNYSDNDVADLTRSCDQSRLNKERCPPDVSSNKTNSYSNSPRHRSSYDSNSSRNFSYSRPKSQTFAQPRVSHSSSSTVGDDSLYISLQRETRKNSQERPVSMSKVPTTQTSDICARQDFRISSTKPTTFSIAKAEFFRPSYDWLTAAAESRNRIHSNLQQLSSPTHVVTSQPRISPEKLTFGYLRDGSRNVSLPSRFSTTSLDSSSSSDDVFEEQEDAFHEGSSHDRYADCKQHSAHSKSFSQFDTHVASYHMSGTAAYAGSVLTTQNRSTEPVKFTSSSANEVTIYQNLNSSDQFQNSREKFSRSLSTPQTGSLRNLQRKEPYSKPRRFSPEKQSALSSAHMNLPQLEGSQSETLKKFRLTMAEGAPNQPNLFVDGNTNGGGNDEAAFPIYESISYGWSGDGQMFSESQSSSVESHVESYQKPRYQTARLMDENSIQTKLNAPSSVTNYAQNKSQGDVEEENVFTSGDNNSRSVAASFSPKRIVVVRERMLSPRERYSTDKCVMPSQQSTVNVTSPARRKSRSNETISEKQNLDKSSNERAHLQLELSVPTEPPSVQNFRTFQEEGVKLRHLQQTTFPSIPAADMTSKLVDDTCVLKSRSSSQSPRKPALPPKPQLQSHLRSARSVVRKPLMSSPSKTNRFEPKTVSALQVTSSRQKAVPNESFQENNDYSCYANAAVSPSKPVPPPKPVGLVLKKLGLSLSPTKTTSKAVIVNDSGTSELSVNRTQAQTPETDVDQFLPTQPKYSHSHRDQNKEQQRGNSSVSSGNEVGRNVTTPSAKHQRHSLGSLSHVSATDADLDMEIRQLLSMSDDRHKLSGQSFNSTWDASSNNGRAPPPGGIVSVQPKSRLGW